MLVLYTNSSTRRWRKREKAKEGKAQTRARLIFFFLRVAGGTNRDLWEGRWIDEIESTALVFSLLAIYRL